uniref:Uncharacterized protein n=1 Tax=Anguilla anguilla TaxID=7936 RepID=A0A0E9UGQ0_ANGAN
MNQLYGKNRQNDVCVWGAAMGTYFHNAEGGCLIYSILHMVLFQ